LGFITTCAQQPVYTIAGPRGTKVGSFAYLVGNPTRKRLEAATVHTGGR